MSLRDYVRKRDFLHTAEPRGKYLKRKGKALRFVIQKHAASRLHYDFRLEMGGTLKSWAVPKGIPVQKGEKRLAVQVEDHPLEYRDFEGIIPKGQYGGGTVMVWDHGTYGSLGGPPGKDLAAGKLHFVLQGKKLNGEWTLVRIKGGEERQWLLIKSGGDVLPVSKSKDDESALSGRTMARIGKERHAEWHSHREKSKKIRLNFIEPMKATLVDRLPPRDGWRYELKFDGYRALALKSGSEVRLLSGNGKSFNERFPEIVEAVAALSLSNGIFDGEVVALDSEGRSSFQLLQRLETGAERPPVCYYIFDLLNEEGSSLCSKPLHERRDRLSAFLHGLKGLVRYSADLHGDPKQILTEVGKHGLEGIIGKEDDSAYQPGRRSRSWIKIKCIKEQEFVIGGWTPPQGSRSHFGALLIGYFEKKTLRFAGKVGTGFDATLLKSIHARMRKLQRKSCPFDDLPEKKQGRWSQRITSREMKLCHWAEPVLVCQVRFTGWTDDGKLRHPVFLGLREDKEPGEIIRERPA